MTDLLNKYFEYFKLKKSYDYSRMIRTFRDTYCHGSWDVHVSNVELL